MAANMRAQDAASIMDKPYVGIVARNMFGLLPIPPPDTNSSVAPVDPPPKITPTGIMTIFGREQALFKAAGKPKPGQPQAKEDAYVLAEGERQDDIEVVKINRLDGIITFNNHGIIQELPLIPAKDAGAGGPGGGGQGNPMRPGSMPGAERGGISRTRPTERPGMNTVAMPVILIILVQALPVSTTTQGSLQLEEPRLIPGAYISRWTPVR